MVILSSSSSSVPDASHLAAMVRMNDLHCPRSFVKSIAPLNVSPNDSMSSFILSIHRSPGLHLFLFPSNLACTALCGSQSIVILSTVYVDLYVSKLPESLLNDFVKQSYLAY